MLRTRIKLTPLHQGRRMSLRDFEPAEWEEGHLYELARGVVVVAEIPNLLHAFIVAFLRERLLAYELEKPTEIFQVLGTMEVVIPNLKSERHPDLAIYKTAPPRKRGRGVWKSWLPDILVEVVAANSADRDYVEKRDEYAALGVKEYWIVDADRSQILVLRRVRGQWSETVLRGEKTLETALLPDFRVSVADVLASGREG